MTITIPNVFIIESLKIYEEKLDIQEGKFLSHLLKLHGKKPIYYYIRTREELKEILKIFDVSKYRYLHIACHGNNQKIGLTFDKISFKDFGKIIRPHLKKKRLFLSACQSTNFNLAKEIIPNTRCYSLIGFENKIGFDDAAIICASFYHLMFKKNPAQIKRQYILPILNQINQIYGVPLRYYSRSKLYPNGIRRDFIR